MNRRAHKPATKDTPFERETKRRRAEMLRNFAGAKANIPPKLLRVLPRSSRKLLLAKPEKRA